MSQLASSASSDTTIPPWKILDTSSISSAIPSTLRAGAYASPARQGLLRVETSGGTCVLQFFLGLQVPKQSRDGSAQGAQSELKIGRRNVSETQEGCHSDV